MFILSLFFWPLYCLYFDGFWLHLWYLLTIVLSVLWWLLITPLVSFDHCIVCTLTYGFCLHLWYLLTIVLSVLWWLLITPLVSFDHCIVCTLTYGFWLHLWYLLTIVLSVLWWLLITPLVSFDHCIVCTLTYGFWLGFWLHLWYLLTIVLSVLWLAASDYTFGIIWPLYCLYFDLRLQITPLVSFDHCIVCTLTYGFWLHLWYLLTIVLSVLWLTASDYTFGIFWPLYCLYFDLRLLITPLVSFDHCIVCTLTYGFWLHLWYLLTIVLSVLWWLLFTPLVSFDHCIVCTLTYGFWLHLWYLLTIVLSVLWWLLFTPLVSFDHCIVCTLTYGFWLHLWYLLTIVLSVLWLAASDYTFGIFWPLYCLYFDLRLLITPLVSFDHCIVCTLTYGFWLHLWYLLTIVLSVLWLTASDYTFGIFWPLYCLYFDLRLLITPLVSFDHCIVCTLTCGFWLHLWYLLTIVLSVLWLTASDYTFGIFWPLYCLYFDGFCLHLWYLLTIVLSVLWWLLFTPLVSFDHCIVCTLTYGFWLHLWYLLAIVLSVLWWLLFIPLVSFDHCIVCTFTYGFWLHLWYLLTIVLSVLWLAASDYTFGIFWPLYCLYFDLRLLITPLVSFDHCIVCTLTYGFWLHLWYLLTIVLSVLWLTASDYTFGIFWPLYCLYFDLRLLITPLVSFDHCIVCTLTCGFWLHLWYLLTIVLSVLWLTASDYTFGIFWPLYCLYFDLRLLITPLVSFDHCIVCTLTCGFWLHLWYLLTIVLSVLWLTASDYTFGIFWPLYCLYFDLRLLITPLVSFDHCIVCTLTCGFWLHLWYLLTIVLSVLWLTASDYTFGIFWPLYCLYFDLRLLITPLVSFDHCIVCTLTCGFWLHLWYLLTIVLSVLWWLLFTPLVSFDHCIVCTLTYGFWLHLWYLLTIVLSVLWLTASDYTFGIFWPLYCLYFDGFCLHLWYLSNFSYNGSMTQPFRKHFKFITEQPNTSRFIWYYHQILSK